MTNGGWGDQDQWAHFGPGEIAWAYVPEAVMPVGGTDSDVPPCSGDTLQLSLYRKP